MQAICPGISELHFLHFHHGLFRKNEIKTIKKLEKTLESDFYDVQRMQNMGDKGSVQGCESVFARSQKTTV